MPPWKNESVNTDPDNSLTGRPRPFLTRADIATLLGMTLCIASLFLLWKREAVDPKMLRSMPATLIVNPAPDFAVTGFGLPLHWPLTFCAVLCGACLLVVPKPQNRSRWAAVQITAAGVCLLLPLIRFALHPGVIVALAGGSLTLLGALERFGIGAGASAKEEV